MWWAGLGKAAGWARVGDLQKATEQVSQKSKNAKKKKNPPRFRLGKAFVHSTFQILERKRNVCGFLILLWIYAAFQSQMFTEGLLCLKSQRT
jgi:hypothetical protein